MLLSIGCPIMAKALKCKNFDGFKNLLSPVLTIKTFSKHLDVVLLFSKRLSDKLNTSGVDIGQITDYSECIH